MASGRLGVASPAATTNTTVYTVTAGKTAAFTVSITNTTGVAITFNLAIAATGTPASTEWIEYGATIAANDIFERGVLVASSTENVVVYSSATGLAVRVYGYEGNPT